MIGCKILINIFFISQIFAFMENDLRDLYESGLESYRLGEYEMSIQKYDLILSKGFESIELYYNLGNAYYRSGDVAGSIWSYENCLKLSPGHKDARYNLKLANLKVIDKIVLPEPPRYINWYLDLRQSFTSSQKINFSLFILFMIIILFSGSRMKIFTQFYILRLVLIFIFFISLYFTLDSIWTTNFFNYGIINDLKIEVRSEPNLLSTRLFEVHEGLKVSVNDKLDKWLEIELLDGKKGWIEIENIRLIK